MLDEFMLHVLQVQMVGRRLTRAVGFKGGSGSDDFSTDKCSERPAHMIKVQKEMTQLVPQILHIKNDDQL